MDCHGCPPNFHYSLPKWWDLQSGYCRNSCRHTPIGVGARGNPLEAGQLEVVEAALQTSVMACQDFRGSRAVAVGRFCRARGGVVSRHGRACAAMCARAVSMHPVPLERSLDQLVHFGVLLSACTQTQSVRNCQYMCFGDELYPALSTTIDSPPFMLGAIQKCTGATCNPPHPAEGPYISASSGKECKLPGYADLFLGTMG